MNARSVQILGFMLISLGLAPSAAFAYVGPGSGITAIGAALALVGSIVLAIVGFVWYPLKRLLQSRRRTRQTAERASADAAVR